MKAPELKKKIDDLIGEEITTKETYLEVVPLLFKLDDAIENVEEFAEKLKLTRKKASEMAATYAIDHTTAFDEPISEHRSGIESATVGIDGTVYRLTISKGKAKRKNGGTMTQDFLAGLPKEWTKTKLDPSFTVIHAKSDAELAKYGLERPLKRVWSVADEVTDK